MTTETNAAGPIYKLGEPMPFDQVDLRKSARLVKGPFQIQVDDQWIVQIDPIKIRESFIRNHKGDEWYRTAKLCLVRAAYDGKDYFTLAMFFFEEDRVKEFCETYKRPK